MLSRMLSFVCVAVAYAAGPHAAEVDKIFAAYNTHTPGCAVGVAEKGAAVLTAGYGMADLERNVAITADTVFESGSVAKQFTAAALILLAQQGKISLDDPMRKYLPELQDYGAPLTIRQVLSHTSGIREWRALAAFSGYPEGKYTLSNQDLLRIASMQRALNFDPGSNYSYTNTGFNISTILIERALGDGRSFQRYTQDVMFGPLEMTHTRWRDDFRAVVPHRALAYRPLQEGGFAQLTPIENIIGAGGLLTTVGDLLRWNENFSHAKVGGRAMVELQQTPATLTSGRKISYAAGLTVSTVDSLREVSHGGATGGYRTWLGRYPDQQVSVAVLCNSASANAQALGRATARLWTGAKPAPEEPVAAGDPAKLAEFAGRYRQVRDNTVSTIEVKDGKLRLDGVTVRPAGDGRFAFGSSGSELRFESGNPRLFRFISSTDDILYERVDPWTPTTADLAAFADAYTSSETGATVRILAGDKAGELRMQIAAEPAVTLKPAFRDTFTTSAGASIRFLREANGKVTGMSAGESRVWDLRFVRVP